MVTLVKGGVMSVSEFACAIMLNKEIHSSDNATAEAVLFLDIDFFLFPNFIQAIFSLLKLFMLKPGPTPSTFQPIHIIFNSQATHIYLSMYIMSLIVIIIIITVFKENNLII